MHVTEKRRIVHKKQAFSANKIDPYKISFHSIKICEMMSTKIQNKFIDTPMYIISNTCHIPVI